jgi:hypothetical protein
MTRRRLSPGVGGDVRRTTGVPQIAADLPQRTSRQPWAITGRSLNVELLR